MKNSHRFRCFGATSLIAMVFLTNPQGVVWAEEPKDYGALDAGFRSFYFDRDKADGLADSEALTQALMLRYESPYVNDTVGFNASWFGNLKLTAEDGKGGTGLLQDEPDGSQKSYGKLAEAFVKLNLPLESTLDVGRMELFTPLLNDPDYRATPTTSQAGLFRIENRALTAYVVGSDKGTAYTETNFHSYTDSNGENFSIFAAGVEYKAANSLFLHGAVGSADNVMDQAYFNARYPWKLNNELNLLFDGYYYSGRANGDGALVDIGPDYRSRLANIALQLSGFNAKFTLSLQSVRGDNYRTSWDGEVHDNTSYFSWQSVQRMNFDRADEDSWQLRFDYNFNNTIEGLYFMGRYISGDNITRQDGLTGSEWERDFDLVYSPPGIENLTLRARNAVVRSTETYDSDEIRLIAQYSFEVF